MKVYIVIELKKDNVPIIRGVFKKKQDAEKTAFADASAWCNVIEKEVL